MQQLPSHHYSGAAAAHSSAATAAKAQKYQELIEILSHDSMTGPAALFTDFVPRFLELSISRVMIYTKNIINCVNVVTQFVKVELVILQLCQNCES